MSDIDVFRGQIEFNRGRTLGILTELEDKADLQAALGWRPGEGRAHIAWQLMHIGVTEDIFGSEHLAPERSGACADWWERFRGGSTPDGDIPSAEQIRDVLQAGREKLLDTVSAKFSDDNLEDDVFLHPRLQKQFTLRQVLQILIWHEAHHQGQAHITKNLFLARG